MSEPLQPGTVTFLEVRHDSWCPVLASGSGSDCLCKPDLRYHKDTKHFIQTELQNRAARRRAAREAAKAVRKAAR